MKPERFTIQIPYEHGVKFGLRLDQVGGSDNVGLKQYGGGKRKNDLLVIKEFSPVILIARRIKEIIENDNNIISCKDFKSNERGCLKMRNLLYTTNCMNLDLDKLIDTYKNTAIEKMKENSSKQIGSLDIYAFHRVLLKAAVVGIIQQYDTIESVQVNDSHKPLKHLKKSTSSNIYRNFMDSSVARRANKLTKTYNFEIVKDDPLETLMKVIGDKTQYPLTITFLRTNLEKKIEKNTMEPSKTHPKRKRKSKKEKVEHKKPRSNSSVSSLNSSRKKIPAKKKEDVICILDSSSDEETNHQTHCNGHSSKDINSDEGKNLPTSNFSQLSINSNSIPTAKPDPTPTHYFEEFVYTPYGPGRILSYNITRNASAPLMNKGSIINPTITYTIEYPFAIGYIESSCIFSLSRSTPAPQSNPEQSGKITSHLCNRQQLQIMASQFSNRQILSHISVTLTELDRLRLWPLTYINDNIINFYLKYLQRYQCKDNSFKYHSYSNEAVVGNEHMNNNVSNDFFIFPTYFYTRISYFEKSTSNGSAYRNNESSRAKLWQDLKGWTKGLDIFKKKYLIIPINYGQHWSSVLVCNLNHLFQKNESQTKNSNVSEQTKSDQSNHTSELKTKKHDDDQSSLRRHTGKSEQITENQSQNILRKSPMQGNIDNLEGLKRGDEKIDPVVVTSLSNSNCNENIKKENSHEVGMVQDKKRKKSLSPNEFQLGNDTVKSFESMTNDIQNKYMQETNMLLKNIEGDEGKCIDENRIADVANDNSRRISPDSNANSDQCEQPQQSSQNNTNEQSKSTSNSDSFSKECKNLLPCIIHLDSGKQFKLHKASTIFRHIRKYLLACYEATKSDSHPGIVLNGSTLLGFSPAVMAQENTMDCGIYMLEIIERILREQPVLKYACRGDNELCVPSKIHLGSVTNEPFSYFLANKKRNRLVALIYKLQHEMTSK